MVNLRQKYLTNDPYCNGHRWKDMSVTDMINYCKGIALFTNSLTIMIKIV